MQIVNHTITLALPDNVNVDNFVDKLMDHITELFFPEDVYDIAISGQEIKKIDFPDPIDSTIEEINKWTEKAMEEIDKEIDEPIPIFKNPYGN